MRDLDIAVRREVVRATLSTDAWEDSAMRGPAQCTVFKLHGSHAAQVERELTAALTDVLRRLEETQRWVVAGSRRVRVRELLGILARQRDVLDDLIAHRVADRGSLRWLTYPRWYIDEIADLHARGVCG
eukprot:gene32359-43065_t